jgi:hypothetical protein
VDVVPLSVVKLYAAARDAGLLTDVQVNQQTVFCEFTAPDEGVLDGLVLNRDYRLRYPAAWLTLKSGDTVAVDTRRFTVREVRALGDGQEHQAWLTLR